MVMMIKRIKMIRDGVGGAVSGGRVVWDGVGAGACVGMDGL